MSFIFSICRLCNRIIKAIYQDSKYLLSLLHSFIQTWSSVIWEIFTLNSHLFFFFSLALLGLIISDLVLCIFYSLWVHKAPLDDCQWCLSIPLHYGLITTVQNRLILVRNKDIVNISCTSVKEIYLIWFEPSCVSIPRNSLMQFAADLL